MMICASRCCQRVSWTSEAGGQLGQLESSRRGKTYHICKLELVHKQVGDVALVLLVDGARGMTIAQKVGRVKVGE